MKDLPEDKWRQKLTPEQYDILRLKGTEAPFTGQYVDHHEDGMYVCAACGKSLFNSATKFDSGSGWPSFWDVASKGNVDTHTDNSPGMSRIEVTCANCGSHLGHLFGDGPSNKTGQRYCINSCSLDFKSKK
ncbi:MAG: peptide-methionine (R)-S-oxide reductase MsrB [Candidatus Berkelbacteria bacterium]|nr:peptide-methionine (R)-S-oxide reductase MsrB [Candidatus Berkelbacteria bacterium]